jgi:hypothetical protein
MNSQMFTHVTEPAPMLLSKKNNTTMRQMETAVVDAQSSPRFILAIK